MIRFVKTTTPFFLLSENTTMKIEDQTMNQNVICRTNIITKSYQILLNLGKRVPAE